MNTDRSQSSAQLRYPALSVLACSTEAVTAAQAHGRTLSGSRRLQAGTNICITARTASDIRTLGCTTEAWAAGLATAFLLAFPGGPPLFVDVPLLARTPAFFWGCSASLSSSSSSVSSTSASMSAATCAACPRTWHHRLLVHKFSLGITGLRWELDPSSEKVKCNTQKKRRGKEIIPCASASHSHKHVTEVLK